jgi:hypothetical protein
MSEAVLRGGVTANTPLNERGIGRKWIPLFDS